MTCYLPNDLSVCVSSGQAIFLDVARDRYFRLPPAQDAVARALIEGGEAFEKDICALRERGILTNSPIEARSIAAVQTTAPGRSLLEECDGGFARPSLRLISETAWTLALAQRRLKRRGLKRTLDRLAMRKQLALAGPEMRPNAIHTLARSFHATRRLVPLNAVCLRDSIALLSFLFRRNITASLVIGVKAQPFSAHCWVQREDVVFNCPLEYAAMFTPIRIV